MKAPRARTAPVAQSASPATWLTDQLARMSAEYQQDFTPTEIAAHVAARRTLSAEQPVVVLCEPAETGPCEITIVGYDYPSAFALITGTLSGAGFAIESGSVFTLAPAPATEAPQDPARARRCLVDRFAGRLPPGEQPAAFVRQMRARLTEVFVLLAQPRQAGLPEARSRINEWVARRLGTALAGQTLFYPIELTVAPLGTGARIEVVGQDTPAFLYALSNALSLQGVSIERVRIETTGGVVHDTLEIAETDGRALDEARLAQIKLAVLLTKQFTYFLAQAPDPYTALERFETLAAEIMTLPEKGRWLDLLGNPQALAGLARILGASDFIWEDFVRTQYEVLLPLMTESQAPSARPADPAELRRRLEFALAAVPPNERIDALNTFKDQEIYRIDLEHLLHAGGDVSALARPLTALAEAVVAAAVELTVAELSPRHGLPRTVGGLPARLAYFGLGKLGGEALGYASDIELLFVYSDAGRTDGPEPLANTEYFETLVTRATQAIRAKREGIFQVDLRLRPYGQSGPRACSLEAFIRYYFEPGQTHAFERLALTRLRWIGGDPELGRQIERLRDEFVYEGPPLDRAALQRLRARQLKEKATPDRLNAKFSPGALVDLEYFVQILQVEAGREHPELRTPHMRAALTALTRAQRLEAAERAELEQAYLFLRRLINALRMLRGNAQDLDLPADGTREFAHVARRMGYTEGGALPPERQLSIEVQTQTALVRRFIERHFGRENLVAARQGNIVDLVLAREPDPALRAQVLERARLRDPVRAYTNLRALAAAGRRPEDFARLAALVYDDLRTMPDPDEALNRWQHLVAQLPNPSAHYAELLEQPRRLEILLAVLEGSQFLATTLTRNPEFMDWATDPARLQTPRTARRMAQDLNYFAAGATSEREWRNRLRRFRRREILRIGTRDFCLDVPLRETTADLAALADTLLEAALLRLRQEASAPDRELLDQICVLGLGKLGGRELNYSSDIDLLAVYQPPAGPPDPDWSGRAARVVENLRAALSEHTEEGYAYRVDMRLRPHGGAGLLVQTVAAVRAYYRDTAAPWELQMLLKARPLVGQIELGERLLDDLRGIVADRLDAATAAREIRTLRAAAIRQAGARADRDVKNGPGGIRDIEFLVQVMQVAHLSAQPALWNGNTLEALGILEQLALLTPAAAAELRGDYIWLRRIEHALQIFEDRQTHSLPEQPAALETLARRLGAEADTAAAFEARLAIVRQRTLARATATLASFAAGPQTGT